MARGSARRAHSTRRVSDKKRLADQMPPQYEDLTANASRNCVHSYTHSHMVRTVV